jgi:uncharacterized damage-inducible protein DinB
MLSQSLIPEFQQEIAQTKKMLERVPYDRYNWKPHEKSTELGKLAVHVAELPGWISLMLKTDELDIGKIDYKPTETSGISDVIQLLEKKAAEAVAAMQAASDEDFLKPWTLKKSGHVIFSLPKVATIRSMAMNHLVHHRGQLSVYLRLLNVPVPGMYGPTADETF